MDTTANVGYIVREEQNRLGDQYVLVTLDGLLLEDCDGIHSKHAEA